MKGMNELTPLVTQPKQFYFFSTRFRISSFFPPFFQLVCSPSMRGFFGFFKSPTSLSSFSLLPSPLPLLSSFPHPLFRRAPSDHLQTNDNSNRPNFRFALGHLSNMYFVKTSIKYSFKLDAHLNFSIRRQYCTGQKIYDQLPHPRPKFQLHSINDLQKKA